MKEAIDLSRLQKRRFHFLLIVVSLLINIGIWMFYPEFRLGFLISYLFQWSILEFRLLQFWRNPLRSAYDSVILGIFSLFGNAVLLAVGLQKLGSNFILGFFLAYFGFLTIFVFVALNSRGSRLPK